MLFLDVLAHLERCEHADYPGPEEDTQEEAGKRGARGAHGVISEKVERAEVRHELFCKVIKHLAVLLARLGVHTAPEGA